MGANVASLKSADNVIKQQLASVGRTAGAAAAEASAGAKAIAAVQGRATKLEGSATSAAKDLVAHSARIAANSDAVAEGEAALQSVANRVSGLEFRSKDLGSLFSLAASTDARSKQNSATLSTLSGSIAAVQKSVSEYESVKVFATRAEQRSRDNADDVDGLDVRLKRQEDVAADLGKRISTQVDGRISAVETTAGAAKTAAATNAKAISDQATSLGGAVKEAQTAAATAAALAKSAASGATAGIKVVSDDLAEEASRALEAEGGIRQEVLDLKAAVAAADGGHSEALDDLHAITKGQAATLEKEVNAEEQRALKAERALGVRISSNTQDVSKLQGTVAALGQQASSRDTAITNLQAAVAAKASADSVNGVAAAVATLQASSTQRAKDIANNAANIKTNAGDIDTTNGRLTAESKRAKAAEAANKATASGLATDRDALKARVSSLEASVKGGSSGAAVEAVEADVADLQTKVGTLATNVKVDGVSRTVTGVSTSLKALGARVDGVSSTVGALQTDVAAKASQSSVNGVDSAVKSVTSVVNGHTSSIAALDKSVKAAAASAGSRASQSAFDKLSKTVSGNSNGVSGLSTSLSKLTSTVNGKASSASLSTTNRNVANEVSRAKNAEAALSRSISSLSGKVNGLKYVTPTQLAALESKMNSAISSARTGAVADAKKYTDSVPRGASAAQVAALIACAASADSKLDSQGNCIADVVHAGFMAELSGSSQRRSNWQLLTRWRWSGFTPGFLKEFSVSSGRFIAKKAGIYSVQANVRIDQATTGYFRLQVAKLGSRDHNNGLHVINGDPTNSYDTLNVGGFMKLNVGEWFNVYVYASSDNYWFINSESGMSCAWVGPLDAEGFQADRTRDEGRRAGWYESRYWRTSGQSSAYATLFLNTRKFDHTYGRYSAPETGYYLIHMNARIDAGNSGYFRFLTSVNGARDVNGGLHTLEGDLANNYESMVSAGALRLVKGDYISQWIYSSDNSWTLQHESGFGAVRLNPMVAKTGFMADLSRSMSARTGWRPITGWRTNGGSSNRLWTSGHFNAGNGYFTAPSDGMYFVSANLRIDSACGAYFRLIAAINGRLDVNHGLSAIDGGPACNYAPLNIAGTVWLTRNQRVNLYVYSYRDNSWTVTHESGFGVVQVA